MKCNLKICENENCWEILWAFPIKKCKFCWWKNLSTHTINLKFIKWIDNQFYHNPAHCWVLENYKWTDHLIIRVPLWDWNDCDNNGWYIHVIWITKEDINFINNYINYKC
jgi:hypothetical protein